MAEREHPTVHRPTARNNEPVILIESDSDDAELVQDELSGRLGGSVESGVATNGGNGIHSDDDISIYRETSGQVDLEDSLNSGAEYIDLEREINTDRSDQHRMTVFNEGRETPVGESDDDNRDDGLVIVQERRAAPVIRLSVPGREFMEISASPYDRPVRRSFERQERQREVREPSRRRLRRAAARAIQSRRQMQEDEDDDDDDDDQLASRQRLPTRLLRRRPQEFFRPQQGLYGEGDPILAELRARVDSFPPNIRSVFNHAHTINEFRSILQSMDPLMWQECNNELELLYNEYRTRRGIVAADQARHISRNPPQRGTGSLHYSERILPPLGVHVGIGSGMGESLTHYLLESEARGHGGYAMAYPGGFLDEMDEEVRTQSIMNAIQEREERERDVRVKNITEKSRPQEEKFLQRCRELPDGYSASFSTKASPRVEIREDGKPPTITVDDIAAEEWEEIAVCCLCGVELGVGIPDDFEGMSKDDRDVPFQSLTTKYDFHCPYQSLARPTKVDRDLSKKTYVAPCGHTYCGRCVVRIRNASTRYTNKESKKKLSQLQGSSHPDNYGPRTCPAADCKQPIRSARSKMREAFL